MAIRQELAPPPLQEGEEKVEEDEEEEEQNLLGCFSFTERLERNQCALAAIQGGALHARNSRLLMRMVAAIAIQCEFTWFGRCTSVLRGPREESGWCCGANASSSEPNMCARIKPDSAFLFASLSELGVAWDTQHGGTVVPGHRYRAPLRAIMRPIGRWQLRCCRSSDSV